MPDPGGDLVMQALYADDAAQAYRQAVARPVRGAFNVAAEPVLDMARLSRLLHGRSVKVPFRAVRAAMSAAWTAHLVPAAPGLLDLDPSCELVPAERCARAVAITGNMWTLGMSEPSGSPIAEDAHSRTAGDPRLMSEGLSPSEVAKELRHHHHEEEAREAIGRAIPVIEAVLLSIVTIVTAWAGYSAAKWSTESRLDLAHASSLRLQANRALATAAELRNFDSSTFSAWFTANTLGNKEKAAIAERRFRPQFRVAFDAWLATNPDTNPSAPPGPTFMKEYVQPDLAKAAALDKMADEATAGGDHAGLVADNYIRITLLLATVLFLVGIGTTFRQKRVRYVLAVVGGVMLLAAVVLIAQQPLPR